MTALRAVAVCLLLVGASPALAAPDAWTNGIDGVGRISISAGWKLAGQDWFFQQSAAEGAPLVSRGIGGPQAFASFGYGAIRWLEVAIDLFLGHDRFQVGTYNPVNVITYGALVGVRAQLMDFLVPGLAPYIGFSIGPTLGYVFTGSQNETFERLVTGVAGVAGIAYRVSDHFGVSIDYRLLYARGVWVTSGLNVGGSFFSVGVVIYFPRNPSESTRMLGGP